MYIIPVAVFILNVPLAVGFRLGSQSVVQENAGSFKASHQRPRPSVFLIRESVAVDVETSKRKRLPRHSFGDDAVHCE